MEKRRKSWNCVFGKFQLAALKWAPPGGKDYTFYPRFPSRHVVVHFGQKSVVTTLLAQKFSKPVHFRKNFLNSESALWPQKVHFAHFWLKNFLNQCTCALFSKKCSRCTNALKIAQISALPKTFSQNFSRKVHSGPKKCTNYTFYPYSGSRPKKVS